MNETVLTYQDRKVVIKRHGAHYRAFQRQHQWNGDRPLGNIQEDSIDEAIASAKAFIDGIPMAEPF